MPASNVSSIVNSWRARRLRAIVSSPMADSFGDDGRRIRTARVGCEAPAASGGTTVAGSRRSGPDARHAAASGHTNAGPCGPAFETLHHPQGVRLDGHLLRGGAATTFRHCTSPPFVRGNRTRRLDRAQDPEVPGRRRSWPGNARQLAAAGPGRAGSAQAARGSVQPDSPARPRSERRQHLEGPVEDRIGAGRRVGGHGHRDVRGQADVVDPDLVGRQPLGDRQPEAATVVGQLLTGLDRALAVRLGCRSAAPGRGPAGRRRRSRWPTRCCRRPAPRP